jgi:anti-sigma factor RsiW
MGEARALQHPWTKRRRRGLRALPLRLLALASLAAVGVAAWWVFQQWHGSGATLPKVLAVAAGLPTEPAPHPAQGAPGVLQRAVDSVAFPDLKRFGWRPIGARSDVVAGRSAVTVFYARDGRQLRYTIVAGVGKVPEPRGTIDRPVTYERRTMRFVSGLADTTTLVGKRAGRTVVLTASAADPKLRSTMLRLASYRAGGRLTF